MSWARKIRRKARAAVPPLVFLGLVAYFVNHALEGERGLRASGQRQLELTQARADLARAEAEAAVWQRRVAALSVVIDTDAVDERARAQLDLSDPADVVVQYDKSQRMF